MVRLAGSIDESWSSGLSADSVTQLFWGTRYIDDAIARRVDYSPGTLWDDDEAFFTLTAASSVRTPLDA